MDNFFEKLRKNSLNNTVLFWSFSISILSFFIFISHHPMHNHGARLPWISFNDQMHAGRWFAGVIFFLLGGANTPVLYPILALAFVIFSALLVYTQISKRTDNLLNRIIFILLISTYPALLSAFFYNWQSVIFCFSLLMASFTAIIITQTKRNLTRLVSGTLLTLLVLATYQSALSLIFTLVFSFWWLSIIRKPEIAPREEIKKAVNYLIPIITGGIFYKFSLIILKVPPSIASETIRAGSFLNTAEKVIASVFESLIITQPDFRLSTKISLLSLIVISLAILFHQSKGTIFRRLSLTVIGFFIVLISTKSMFFISNSVDFHRYRYNFALGYFYAIMAFVSLEYFTSKFLRRLAQSICIIVVYSYVQANLVRQLIILRGQQHDISVATRILRQIENLPDIDFSKKYLLLKIGNFSDFRNELLTSKGHSYDIVGDEHMDESELTAPWAPAEIFRLLGSKVKFKYYSFTPNFQELIDEEIRMSVKNRKPFPHKESVYIREDRIILLLNNPNLNRK